MTEADDRTLDVNARALTHGGLAAALRLLVGDPGHYPPHTRDALLREASRRLYDLDEKETSA